MSDLAILIEGPNRSPRAVRIAPDGGDLLISKSDGSLTRVPWWRLFRIEDHGTTHRFRRLDSAQWELQLVSGSDRELLSHIGHRRLGRTFSLLHRLHGVKILIGVAVLAVTFVDHMPADWTDGAIPNWAEQRLVSGVVGQTANSRCTSAAGNAALQKLLVRLDPQIGPKVEIIGLREYGLLVSSLPANHLVIYRFATTEIEQEALAALLAHELSHLKHGDPITAAVRNYGHVGAWAAIMQGEDRRDLHLEFSSAEESRADLEAMSMMRRAGIPMEPAAELFHQMYVASNTGSLFAIGQRDFHFGLPHRAARWRAAADAQTSAHLAPIPAEEADEIFNFCWLGRVTPQERTQQRSSEPLPEPVPGRGGLRLESGV